MQVDSDRCGHRHGGGRHHHDHHDRQLFYNEAMLALLQTGDAPDPWLIGAILTNHWGRESGESVNQQLKERRPWVEN